MAERRGSRGEAPHLIVVAGEVLTQWPSQPRAEAVALKDGLISAVGSRREVLALAGPRTQVVEYPEGCVLPGLHDTHIHLVASAARRLSVDCSPPAVSSIAQMRQTIGEMARSTPRGRWIRAGNYDEFRLAEGRHPTRQELDAAAPHHPVRLMHRSLHACVLNSAALQASGLWPLRTPGVEALAGTQARSVEASTSGPVVEIDPTTGEPTGLVYEYGSTAGDGMGVRLEEGELRESLRHVMAGLVACGVTSVQDAGAANGLEEWNRFQQLCSESAVRPRVGFMVGMDRLDQFVGAGMGPGHGDGWLRLGAAKVMLTESSGDFRPSLEELFGQVRRANQLGYQVAIHAVEESAICVAAEVLAAAPPKPGQPRHRIEHCSVLPPPLLDRLAQVGVSVATQPVFLYESGDRYLAEVEGQLQGWLYPLRSLLEKGIQVGGGSDAPVASFDPMEGIQAAVTRLSRRGKVVWEPERIPVEDALRMYTLGAATICGEEERLGSIEPGKLADLVVLSADPTSVEADDLRDIRAEMTVIGGRIVWRR